jgi:hypothetical protein
MQSGHQAVRWRFVLGLTFQFRAFCCDINSDGIMGVSKQPVPVLSISPNPVCLGDAISWDLSNSYAPGSAIVSYAIDMDDGTQYFVASGNHTYGAVGTYTITASVTEGLGKTQEIEQEVEVIDCTEGLLVGWVYASLDGDGVWYYEMSSATWTQRSGGLTGSALNVNSIALRPGDKRLPNTVHQLYAATDGGVFRTHNGGRSWEQILLPDPSNAEFADAPAATVDELVFHKVVYSLEDPELLWVLASKASPARIWVYSTDDGGVDWTSRGLLT